jgi:hypothetical protein
MYFFRVKFCGFLRKRTKKRISFFPGHITKVDGIEIKKKKRKTVLVFYFILFYFISWTFSLLDSNFLKGRFLFSPAAVLFYITSVFFTTFWICFHRYRPCYIHSNLQSHHRHHPHTHCVCWRIEGI